MIDPYPLTIHRADGRAMTEWVQGSNWSGVLDLTGQFRQATRLEVVAEYLALGYTHILPKGLDHILFVLGLFLLSVRVRPILIQVTTFTIAHSITLGLTMYGIVSLSPRLVEPLIALSIAYVAVENLITSELKPWRLGLVFMFGLLHGMGFAGVLAGLGLPRADFLTALLSFNVGVEAGQLTVIAFATVCVVSVSPPNVVSPARGRAGIAGDRDDWRLLDDHACTWWIAADCADTRAADDADTPATDDADNADGRRCLFGSCRPCCRRIASGRSVRRMCRGQTLV